jgi:hypothetical protein
MRLEPPRWRVDDPVHCQRCRNGYPQVSNTSISRAALPEIQGLNNGNKPRSNKARISLAQPSTYTSLPLIF